MTQDRIIRNEDIDVSAYPDNRVGGQQVGKMSFGVRLRHIPTGLEFIVTEERSMYSNKMRAMGYMRDALREMGWTEPKLDA